jgi:outer membrane protein assembly factor BamB
MRAWLARINAGDVLLVAAMVAVAATAVLIWGPAKVSGYVAVVPILGTLLAGLLNWTRRTPAAARQAALETARGERDSRLRVLADYLRGIGADASAASSMSGHLKQWEPAAIEGYLRGTELAPWEFVRALVQTAARLNGWSAESRASYEKEARQRWGAAVNAVNAAADAKRAVGLAAVVPRGPRRVLFWLRSRRVLAGAGAVAAVALFAVWLANRPSPLPAHADGPAPLPAYEWTRATGGAVQSSPCVAGATVYVASDDHYLYAVDATNGRVRWRDNIGSQNGSSPACAYGNVYIGSWNTGDILAINAAGHVLWKYPTTSSVGSSPVVAEGVVYVGSDSTRLYALDARTGHLKWYKHVDGEINARPFVMGGVVYVGSHGGEVYAINASNGDILWDRRTGGAIDGSGPTVADGMVYVGSGDHLMYALDQATGHVRWTFVAHEAVESAPLVAGGIVYFGSEDSTLYAVSARSGKLIWNYVTEGYVDSNPAVARGDVFVGSDDGRVYALNAVSGALVWSCPTGGQVESGPAAPATTDTVYVGSDDGSLYALKVANRAVGSSTCAM